MIPPVDEEDFEMIQVPETTSSPFRVTRKPSRLHST